MIDCQFRTEHASCRHIDAAVGELVILHESVCTYCTANHKPSDRQASYVVQNRIWGERKKRGLEVGELPKLKPPTPTAVYQRVTKPRPNVADELLAAARSVPRVTRAPVVSEAADRLEICDTQCDFWIDGRCKAKCSCVQRPRPMNDKGPDCPLGLWRRR